MGADATGPDLNTLNDLIREAHLRLMGLDKDDLGRPIIAVVNSKNDIVLGHLHLDRVAQSVREGVLQEGGVPLEFNTIAVCDVLAHGRPGMRYVLPSRDIIADSIEVMVKAHGLFSGIVAIGGCDKIIPGMLMALGRLDMPSIVVPAGPVMPLTHPGHIVDGIRRPLPATAAADPFLRRAFVEGMMRFTDFAKQSYLKGHITASELVDYYVDNLPTCGTCNTMATANTMACLTEGLGMCLPGGALAPAPSHERLHLARQSGRAVVRLVREGVTARAIMTREAFENGLRLDMAAAGSMNSILHLIAIADACGVSITYDDFAAASAKTPFIVNVHPNGEHRATDLYAAGGVPAVLHEILGLLHAGVRTVSGRTLAENVATAEVLDRRVIWPLDAPIRPDGGISMLRGSLAPGGAIVKPPVMGGCLEFSGPAVVFESEEDFFAAARVGRVKRGSVVVLRYEGPRGGPGMREAHRTSEGLRAVGGDVALVTDGRYSGATIGVTVGYVLPEAADGGPIAVVRDGDPISISLPRGRVDLLLPADEVRRRLACWRPLERPVDDFLRRYAAQVRPADNGAVLRPPSGGPDAAGRRGGR